MMQHAVDDKQRGSAAEAPGCLCNLQLAPPHLAAAETATHRRIEASLRRGCKCRRRFVFLVHETKTTFCVPAYPISPY